MNIEPHNPCKLYRGIPYLVCSKCGLVYLNNALTKWCIRNGCDHKEHPQYKNKLKELVYK